MDGRGVDDREGAPAEGVDVECLSCGRRVSFEPQDRRVAGRPLVELTRRLLCSQCGSRAVRARTVRTPRDLARRLRDRIDRG